MSQKSNMDRITVFFPRELRDQLAQAASMARRKPADLLRVLVDDGTKAIIEGRDPLTGPAHAHAPALAAVSESDDGMQPSTYEGLYNAILDSYLKGEGLTRETASEAQMEMAKRLAREEADEEFGIK